MAMAASRFFPLRARERNSQTELTGSFALRVIGRGWLLRYAGCALRNTAGLCHVGLDTI